MPAIGIGIPVFNEAARLQGCLENIAGQTFGDFRAVIVDNASTDDTGGIAQAFAARDARFSYRRQPHNRGAMANFATAFESCDGAPYFAWRAPDDRWDANYLGVLRALLETHPDKALAVAGMIGTFRGRVIRKAPIPRYRFDGRLSERVSMLFLSSPSWTYGLFRRAALAPLMQGAWQAYGDDGWASDFLILLPFFLDGTVVGTNATGFEQALNPRAGAPGEPRPPRTEPDLDARLALRRRFLDIATGFIEARASPGPERTFWRAMLFLYADRRVYKTRHIVRRRLKRLVGLKP